MHGFGCERFGSPAEEDEEKKLNLQDLLERNADVIYGAAGGCVGLALIILMISSPTSSWSPSYSSVFSSNSATRSSPPFKTSPSDAAELYASKVQSAFSPSGSSILQESSASETKSLKAEVSELKDKVKDLEKSLRKMACVSIVSTTRGVCSISWQHHKGEGRDAHEHRKSSKPKLIRPGYRKESKKWTQAKDHWAATYVKFKDGSRLGFWMNTHNPDSEDTFISKAIHNKQIWDKPVWRVFKHVLVNLKLPPGLVLDVGANLGYFSLWALAMGHRVVSFEPMDFNLRYFIMSIEYNGYAANHTLYQNTVGNSPGRVTLKPTNELNRGNFQVQEDTAGFLRGGEYGIDYAETIRLDDVVKEDVLLMKIDVEGFEHRVLDSGKRLICNHVVRFIEFEFTTSKSDKLCPAEQTLCWMQSVGYRVSGLDDLESDSELDLQDWAKFPSELLLTLKNPELPPGLLIELSGAWINPCKDVIEPVTSPVWDSYKDRWCVENLRKHASSFVPCQSWGSVSVTDQRLHSAIGCDSRLGFTCERMELDKNHLQTLARRSSHDGNMRWLEDWLGYNGYVYTKMSWEEGSMNTTIFPDD
mmetsp:Transcript_9230/g.30823  ORF Transcript_9230/g.30823 Transcript_9230/m.30823 type:complete len:587 (-) Transcript_9230:392-2152(-)